MTKRVKQHKNKISNAGLWQFGGRKTNISGPLHGRTVVTFFSNRKTNKSIDRQAAQKRAIEFLRNLQLQKPFAPVDHKLKFRPTKDMQRPTTWGLAIPGA